MYDEVVRLLNESPMPWTWAMLRDWMGWSDSKASVYLNGMVSSGRIGKIEVGVYTAKHRVPLQPPPMTVEPVQRLPFALTITDDMLARYGYKL